MGKEETRYMTASAAQSLTTAWILINGFFFFFSLMLPLVSTAKEVRAAGLRAFRHLFSDSKTLSKMLDFRIDIFVVR